MAFEAFVNLGSGASDTANALQTMNDFLFGSPGGNVSGQSESTAAQRAIGGSTVSRNRRLRQNESSREGLEISDEAIQGIIQDIMSEAGGLAEIFSAEQRSGLYNSSVAKEEAGDLAAKILAEVGKLRATKVRDARTTGQDIGVDRTRQRQYQSGEQTNRSYQDTDGGGGLLDNLGIG